MKKNAKRDAAHRYESMGRRFKKLQEGCSSYEDEFFIQFSNIIDSNWIDTSDVQDRALEDEYDIQNYEMIDAAVAAFARVLEDHVPDFMSYFNRSKIEDLIY